jgi:hypothetical protein
MDCHEAKEFVSVLYDGERVPADCAEHVDGCADCRERLRAYAQIGAELRLMASRATWDSVMPIGMLQKIKSTRRRIQAPRFAVGLAAGLVLALTPSWMMLHAQQNNKLWFQYAAERGDGSSPIRDAVKAGSDQDTVWGSDPSHILGIRVAVLSIAENSVKVGVRARRYSASNADQIHVKRDMPDLSGHTYTYVPGEALQIPIEGGSTLVLKGHVLDHQPKLMFGGIPVEPEADQLVISSPALIQGKSVLGNFKGATGLAEGSDEMVAVYVPGVGLMRFALQPFPGAIEGKASWGNLDFKWNGTEYSVLTATQIAGGEQPRAVWVKNDAEYAPKEGDPSHWFLGIDKLSAPRF